MVESQTRGNIELFDFLKLDDSILSQCLAKEDLIGALALSKKGRENEQSVLIMRDTARQELASL